MAGSATTGRPSAWPRRMERLEERPESISLRIGQKPLTGSSAVELGQRQRALGDAPGGLRPPGGVERVAPRESLGAQPALRSGRVGSGMRNDSAEPRKPSENRSREPTT